MSETLTLQPFHYGKIGVVHCGVTREGTVSCGGDIARLEDGGQHRFDRGGILVRRNGSDYRFERAGD